MYTFYIIKFNNIIKLKNKIPLHEIMNINICIYIMHFIVLFCKIAIYVSIFISFKSITPYM